MSQPGSSDVHVPGPVQVMRRRRKSVDKNNTEGMNYPDFNPELNNTEVGIIKAALAKENVGKEWDESKHPRTDSGQFGEGGGTSGGNKVRGIRADIRANTVIGATKSGKPIRGSFDHSDHANFNRQDHQDAADAHDRVYQEKQKQWKIQDAKEKRKSVIDRKELTPEGLQDRKDQLTEHQLEGQKHQDAANKNTPEEISTRAKEIAEAALRGDPSEVHRALAEAGEAAPEAKEKIIDGLVRRAVDLHRNGNAAGTRVIVGHLKRLGVDQAEFNRRREAKKSFIQKFFSLVRKELPRRVSTVAVTHGGKILMGKRRDNGKWTFPGGHVDSTESMHEGGLRELKEETGLESDQLKELTPVHKLTGGDGRPLHVQAFHHPLKEKPSTSMKQDPDAEVHRWQWVDMEDMPSEISKNLHVPAHRNVLMHAMGLVDDDVNGDEFEVDKDATPDAATADDVNPRTADYDGLPIDMQMALHALDYELPDQGTSRRGNVIAGYPSQGAVAEDVDDTGSAKIKKSAYENLIPIAKADSAKQIIYCVVLTPEEEDLQGDFMLAPDIEEAAHNYLKNSRVIGSNHSKAISAYPVESYIAPVDFTFPGSPEYQAQEVKKGSWVIGVKIVDPKEWQKVEDGEYEGVSVGGFGLRDPVA